MRPFKTIIAVMVYYTYPEKKLFFYVQCRGSGVPRVGNVRENFGGSAILAVRRTLTGSRGEYLRVVGIHSGG